VIIEGTSDYAYLQIISDYLKSKNREGLDERWSLIPVGGIDLIPTFVALLGNHLDMTVLIDSQREGYQKLSNLSSKGFLSENRIITMGNILGKKFADIEDLFDVDDYLKLFNRAFKKNINKSELVGNDPIVNQISRFLKIPKFDHGLPADNLLHYRDELLPTFSNVTFDQFERLFSKINLTFPNS
jgi:hypothetical protein